MRPFFASTFERSPSKSLGLSLPYVFAVQGKFDPIPALNPVLRYDFSRLDTLTLSGSEITAVTNQGSIDMTLSKAGTGPTSVNFTGTSIKCADFGAAGSNNSLVNAASTSMNVRDAFFVLDGDFGSTFGGFYGLIGGGSSGWNTTGQGGANYFYFDSSYFTELSIDATTPTSLNTKAVLPTIDSPSILWLRRAASAFTNTNGVRLAGDRGIAGRGWGGLIGEVVIFSTLLSDTDATVILNHLKDKWSIA